MTTHEDVIEFPGDPMCLYSALSYSISNVQLALRNGITDGPTPYNDFCPAWGATPTKKYRLAQSENGIRPIRSHPNTDETVFDPRVWNDETRQYLVELLSVVRPLVVLISSVSPAHRYALEMAQCVKDNLPRSLVILGGRHVDETIRYDDRVGTISLAPSSTIDAISTGKANDVVDFLVAGQAYYSLDTLLRAISLGIGLDRTPPSRERVVQMLVDLGSGCDPVPGRSTIVIPSKQAIEVFPTNGSLDLARLPSPYKYFAIRARFPIFMGADGKAKRTAHMLTAVSCPYQCSFCSESRAVVGQGQKIGRKDQHVILDRILEYVGYGAEALFFDESVFLSGDFGHMLEFSQMLAREKIRVALELASYGGGPDAADQQRFLDLEWGAQLTVNLLLDPRAHEVLKSMYAVGCNYLYVGIESLAESVIAGVDKYKQRSKQVTWEQQVTQVLTMVRSTGIRVGSSVLFGLDGETPETIDYTISGIKKLIDEGLLYVVSPNILTYHPGAKITRLHEMVDKLDYASTELKPKPPYTHFEEAYPGVVSRLLNESTIAQIDKKASEQWTARNRYKMRATIVPVYRRLANKAGWLNFQLAMGDKLITGSGRVDPNFAGGIQVPRRLRSRLIHRGPVKVPAGVGQEQEHGHEGDIYIGPVGPLRCSVTFADSHEYVIGRAILMGAPVLAG